MNETEWRECLKKTSHDLNQNKPNEKSLQKLLTELYQSILPQTFYFCENNKTVGESLSMETLDFLEQLLSLLSSTSNSTNNKSSTQTETQDLNFIFSILELFSLILQVFPTVKLLFKKQNGWSRLRQSLLQRQLVQSSALMMSVMKMMCSYEQSDTLLLPEAFQLLAPVFKDLQAHHQTLVLQQLIHLCQYSLHNVLLFQDYNLLSVLVNECLNYCRDDSVLNEVLFLMRILISHCCTIAQLKTLFSLISLKRERLFVTESFTEGLLPFYDKLLGLLLEVTSDLSRKPLGIFDFSQPQACMILPA
jgi:hypothetical protein